MFRSFAQIAGIIFIWELIDDVLSTKLTCSRMQDAHLWIQHGDTCYQVRNEVKRQYVAGRDYCHEHCSEFVTPNSRDENNWIWDTFKEHYTDSPDILWLGCNNTSGQWVCLGDTEDNKYRNWKREEPTVMNECVYMDKADGTWDVMACGWSGKWTMCEAPAEPPFNPLKVRCNAVAIPSGSCPVPIHTVKVTSPMQCCLACAKQCNCRSLSLTGNIDCQMNLGKINDPVTTLTNQTCEYYEYEIQN